MQSLRRRMTYANVMSTLAVFIALGGSSYAAIKISGANIRNASIPAKKLKRNSLTAREVRESRLGRVPRAATADRVGGFSGAQLRLHCPPKTVLIASICIDSEKERGPAPYDSAVLDCLSSGSGWRLPSHQELRAAMTLTTLELSPTGELTSSVSPSNANPAVLDVVVLLNKLGAITVVPDAPPGSRSYRCVTDPINGTS